MTRQTRKKSLNLYKMHKSSNPADTLHQLMKKHGPHFKVKLFHQDLFCKVYTVSMKDNTEKFHIRFTTTEGNNMLVSIINRVGKLEMIKAKNDVEWKNMLQLILEFLKLIGLHKVVVSDDKTTGHCLKKTFRKRVHMFLFNGLTTYLDVGFTVNVDNLNSFQAEQFKHTYRTQQNMMKQLPIILTKIKLIPVSDLILFVNQKKELLLDMIIEQSLQLEHGEKFEQKMLYDSFSTMGDIVDRYKYQLDRLQRYSNQTVSEIIKIDNCDDYVVLSEILDVDLLQFKFKHQVVRCKHIELIQSFRDIVNYSAQISYVFGRKDNFGLNQTKKQSQTKKSKKTIIAD